MTLLNSWGDHSIGYRCRELITDGVTYMEVMGKVKFSVVEAGGLGKKELVESSGEEGAVCFGGGGSRDSGFLEA